MQFGHGLLRRTGTWVVLLASVLAGQTARAAPPAKDIFSTMTNLIDLSGILPNTETNPEVVIGRLITVLLGFLGILFFILIIYGGFLWMTARGVEEQVSKAKKIITSASIGLAVVLSAYLISYIVLQLLTAQTADFSNPKG